MQKQRHTLEIERWRRASLHLLHEKKAMRRFGAGRPFIYCTKKKPCAALARTRLLRTKNVRLRTFFWEIRTAFVGANRATLRLFAKALFLTIHPQWMYRPLREQVRSQCARHGPKPAT
ncbi:hypothetical protein KPSA1_03313 [Pseudomonas syringae pv. actinidiae]|uniref:Uncharacterized protein n=1 Tax=Pseudomonas syringae pv. actinidiae TaxID=103796 RepID=A0A2V0QA87_PSESF|nr:hypothetical protein KPSA1_03313 [Pseudomonas syringae pv. actinidiae]